MIAVRFELLCKIALNSTDADTILKYSEQAIKLAEKLNINPCTAYCFTKGLATSIPVNLHPHLNVL